MKEYKLTWTEEVMYESFIKARDEDHAEEKFWGDAIPPKRMRIIETQGPEDLEIEEV